MFRLGNILFVYSTFIHDTYNDIILNIKLRKKILFYFPFASISNANFAAKFSPSFFVFPVPFP